MILHNYFGVYVSSGFTRTTPSIPASLSLAGTIAKKLEIRDRVQLMIHFPVTFDLSKIHTVTAAHTGDFN